MILPALQQKGKVGRFTFEGESLEQVEAEDGLIVHLDHQRVCLSVKQISSMANVRTKVLKGSPLPEGLIQRAA